MNIQPEKAQGEASGRAKSRTDAELPVDEASGKRRGACVKRERRLASTPSRPGGPFPYRMFFKLDILDQILPDTVRFKILE